ncbi:SDR family NAD(P)-dependent oxidoreductase [Kribbella sp. NPDC026611]|uniref:SDR family NAD(P)-dependent oxidoreductase n=1 Tax=Kribbella sp. NPDC026611 TaxID=3154911 RepID=UPI0033EDE723
MTTLDTVLDRLILPGYTTLGYRLRSRHWPANDPAPNSLHGKRALVTGAASGLGKATAAGLGRLGAVVHLLVRDAARAEPAVSELRKAQPDAEFIVDECDVSDLDAIRLYAQQATTPDILIHNAGVLPAKRKESPQGHELTLATHVLGPLLLTELLKPTARVIFIASGGMYTQPLPEDPEYTDRPYRGATAYARTKRIQVELTPLMATHFAPTTIATMHPGWSDTPGLTSSLPGFAKLTRPLLRSVEEGADTAVWLAATEPAPPTGRFWHDRRIRPTHYLPTTHTDPARLRAMWTYCQSASRIT